ncbi:MAG: DUF3826 domain-containing protein [Pirellulales bacterium]
MRPFLLTWAAVLSLVFGLRGQAAPTAEEEAAYTQSITARADKIVAPLAIADAAKASRVRDLIVQQYRDLRDVHAARDAKIAQVKPSDDASLGATWKSLAQKEADLNIFPLHRRFVARLESELTPEQVNQVKDGMTYGVVPLTYRRYHELLPDLTVEQQAEILANLLEAREYAMDAGSSEDKHAWFGKYKGRINNYLSAAGYNMKQAEQDLAEREKAAQ